MVSIWSIRGVSRGGLGVRLRQTYFFSNEIFLKTRKKLVNIQVKLLLPYLIALFCFKLILNVLYIIPILFVYAAMRINAKLR